MMKPTERSEISGMTAMPAMCGDSEGCPPLRAYLLNRFAEANRLYQDWPARLSVPCEIVDEYLPEWQPPADAGILITHLHYRWEDLAALRRVYEEQQIPVLILSDGILEYRNTWQNPTLPAGCLFQPVFGHKLACLGRAPARWLEAWGNVGKCEVVGLPRLDSVQQRPLIPLGTAGKFRLLVATARTPAFDPPQRETVIASLKALKSYLDKAAERDGRVWEVQWRLTEDLYAEVGLAPQPSAQSLSLIEQIDQVDAVVITPSTGYLESLLRGRPTAILDYHNTPSYLSSAWTISADAHLDRVISELSEPPPAKMLYQSQLLNDQLECRTPATPRLVALIEGLLAARRQSLLTGKPLAIPPRMLTDEQQGFAAVPEDFDLTSLFPEVEGFQTADVQRLQIELAAAIQALGDLPAELAERESMIVRLKQALEQAKLRNREMHVRWIRLQKKFGITPRFDVE
jgi:hypothetical protein